MKYRVLYYGNCQSGALASFIKLDPNEYKVIDVLCHKTPYTKDEFIQLLQSSDIVITQPISDGYRDVDYLSSSFVIENCPGRVIIFDSCWFDFYYPDLHYKLQTNGQIISHPHDYHYHSLIEKCYIAGKPIPFFITESVENASFLSREELEERAEKSLQELEKRYHHSLSIYATPTSGKVQVVTMVDYIRENYKKVLLFYSVNHPTKYLFQVLAERILNVSNIPFNSWSIAQHVDPLNGYRGILYRCVRDIVDFDTTQYSPYCLEETDVDTIAHKYIQAYTSQNIQF